jgi:hypothetical protein
LQGKRPVLLGFELTRSSAIHRDMAGARMQKRRDEEPMGKGGDYLNFKTGTLLVTHATPPLLPPDP